MTAGVRIVPVISAGAHSVVYVVDDGQWLARMLRLDTFFRLKVCPITLSFPWGVTVGPPPPYVPWPSRFFQEALPPIVFDRHGAEAAADAAYVDRSPKRFARDRDLAVSAFTRSAQDLFNDVQVFVTTALASSASTQVSATLGLGLDPTAGEPPLMPRYSRQLRRVRKAAVTTGRDPYEVRPPWQPPAPRGRRT